MCKGFTSKGQQLKRFVAQGHSWNSLNSLFLAAPPVDGVGSFFCLFCWQLYPVHGYGGLFVAVKPLPPTWESDRFWKETLGGFCDSDAPRIVFRLEMPHIVVLGHIACDASIVKPKVLWDRGSHAKGAILETGEVHVSLIMLQAFQPICSPSSSAHLESKNLKQCVHWYGQPPKLKGIFLYYSLSYCEI